MVLAAFGGIAASALLLLNAEQPASAQPTIPAGYDLSAWHNNGQDGEYLLQVVDGVVPPAGTAVSGVVLSDTDCEPDAQGLNHCHNGIRLADGTTLNAIDNHMMSLYRCPKPGETVTLTRFDDAWVVAAIATDDPAD